jgi:hypothetical protein
MDLCPILLCLAGLVAGDAALASSDELPGGIRLSVAVDPPVLQPGQIATLAVTVHLPSGWIIYDLEQAPDSVLPTSIRLEATAEIAPLENFRSEGAQERLEPSFSSRIARFFDRTPTFRRPILVGDQARPGGHDVVGSISFLAQHHPSKRFYYVSHAPFRARLMVELPAPTVTTDNEPLTSPTEAMLSPAKVEAVLRENLPRVFPPAPPFAIRVDAPLSGDAAAPASDAAYGEGWLAGAVVMGLVVLGGLALPSFLIRVVP